MKVTKLIINTLLYACMKQFVYDLKEKTWLIFFYIDPDINSEETNHNDFFFHFEILHFNFNKTGFFLVVLFGFPPPLLFLFFLSDRDFFCWGIQLLSKTMWHIQVACSSSVNLKQHVGGTSDKVCTVFIAKHSPSLLQHILILVWTVCKRGFSLLSANSSTNCLGLCPFLSMLWSWQLIYLACYRRCFCLWGTACELRPVHLSPA